MSSASPTSSSATPAVSSSAPFTSQTNANDGANPFMGNAQLYLYIFLGTVILLLIITSSIITRTLILRRRHRRRIARARADGSFTLAMLNPALDARDAALLPRGFGDRRGWRDRLYLIGEREREPEAGEKPVFREVHVPQGGEKGAWAALQPMTAHVGGLPPPPPPPTATTPAPAPSPAQPAVPPSRFARLARNLPRISAQRPSWPDTLPPAAAAPGDAAPPEDVAGAPGVRVGVLISMPDAARALHKPGDEAPAPVCEIGVARVRLGPALEEPRERRFGAEEV